MNEYRCTLDGPERGQRGGMRRRAIALVLGEPVARILGVHRDHQPVPADLRQHAGRSDARRRCVPADHRQRRHRQPRHPEAVGQHVPGPDRKTRDRTAHALDVGDVNAAPVDLARRHEHHVIGERIPADQREQRLTRFLGQLLRIVEIGEALEPVRPEHARGDHQRSGTGAAADLVDAGHRAQDRCCAAPTRACAAPTTCGSLPAAATAAAPALRAASSVPSLFAQALIVAYWPC